MFLRKTTVGREPLAVAMAGVRLGERVLQIGDGDPKTMGALAAKTGLSGHAAVVAADERAAGRARSAAEKSASAIDVHVAPLHALPFEAASFDVVVIHNVDGGLSARDGGAGTAALADCFRVLRKGGRAVVIDRGTPTGLGALLTGSRRAPETDPGVMTTALEAAGFRPARLLADREGYRFFEGLKG